MVGEAIRGILDGGARKVIIPGCGTFIRRESGELVFTELLRTDDGRLTAALAASQGIAPEAARKLVEAYAAALNRKLAGTGRMTVEGVGTIVRTAAGNYTVEPQNGTVSQQTESEPIRQTEPPRRRTFSRKRALHRRQTPPGQPTRMRKNGRRRPRPVSDRKRSSRTKESGRRQSTPPAPTYGRYGKSRLRSALYGDREPDDEETAEHQQPLSESLPDKTRSVSPAAIPAATATAPSSSGNDGTTEYTPQIHIRRPGKPKKTAGCGARHRNHRIRHRDRRTRLRFPRQPRHQCRQGGHPHRNGRQRTGSGTGRRGGMTFGRSRETRQ